MRREERILLAIASLGHALCHGSTLILQQVVAEAARDLETARIGATITVISFLMGALAIPAGLLSDRLGPRRTYSIWLGAMVLAGIAAGIARSPWLFLGAAGLVGAAAAFHHPVGLAWIAQGIPGRRSEALGIHGFVGHFGSTLAPMVVLFLHAQLGWRSAYFAASLLALLLWLALRVAPRTAAEDGPIGGAEPGPARGRLALVLAPAVVVVLLALTPNGFVHQGFWASWTSFLKDESGATRVAAGPARASLEPVASSLHAALPASLALPAREGESPLAPVAGLLATIVLAFGSAGELFGGRVARRGARFAQYAWMNLVSAAGLAGLCLVEGGWLLLCGALFAFFHFGTQPIENDLLAQRADPRVRGLAYGLKFTATFGVGSIASWLAIDHGYLRHGYVPVFAGLATSAVVGAALVGWLGLRDRRGRVSAASPFPRAP